MVISRMEGRTVERELKETLPMVTNLQPKSTSFPVRISAVSEPDIVTWLVAMVLQSNVDAQGIVPSILGNIGCYGNTVKNNNVLRSKICIYEII